MAARAKKNRDGMYSLSKKERMQNVPNKRVSMAKTVFSISVAGVSGLFLTVT